MAIIKEALAITFAAGLLAAGVTAHLSRKASEPVGQPVPAEVSGPSSTATVQGDVAQANERMRDALSNAYGLLPATTPPADGHPPAPSTAEAPASDPLATVINRMPDEAAQPGQGINANPPAKPPDPTWVPTPRPDLIAKADARFDNGDVAGARFWLEAALEEGDADAAFRLAETYDPASLSEWKVIGIASDVSKARSLYERAMHGGIEGASQRMARLTP